VLIGLLFKANPMKAKVVKLRSNEALKPYDEDDNKLLSFEECKAILNSNGEHYTDDEIKYLSDVIHKLAKLNYIYFIECKQKQEIENLNNNIIQLKTNINNETQSNSLCESEYRRAS
jgi:hypothetical protein